MRKNLFATMAGTTAIFFMANNAQAATVTLTPAQVQADPAAIQKALVQLYPGETLYLAGGTYTPTHAGSGIPNDIDTTLDIRPTRGYGRSGSPGAYITVRNKPGEKVVVNLGTGGKGGFNIIDASYWRVEGLEFAATPDSRAYGGGLETVSWQSNAHHIQFVNNIVHGFGASGIGANNVSQVLIEGNTVYNNCYRSSNGTSGINLGGLSMKSNDNSGFAGPLGNPGNQYAMIVRNNRAYYNRNLWPDSDHGSSDLSDGNGITVDYSDETGFTGKVLIANNIVYNNGGAGIHIFKSSNCDVFHNTAYQNAWLANGTQLSSFGPLNISGVTRNNRFFNNIAVGGNPNMQNGTYINGGKTGGGNRGWQNGDGYAVGAEWRRNLFFNTSDTKFPSDSIWGNVDPKFVNPKLDTTGPPTADFHLQSGSWAINFGVNSSTTGVTYDHDLNTRDSNPDLGAYEAVGITAPVPGGNYKVRFWPNRGTPSYMVGGYFQGSNTSMTSGYVTLGIITTTPTIEDWTEMYLGGTTYRYWRYVSPDGGYGHITELEFYNGATKLTGTTFGTASSTGKPYTNAFDNFTYNTFESFASGAYVGIDTGTGGSTPTPTPTPPPTPTPNCGPPVDRTLESGGIITARGDYAAGGEGKEKAFDNNTGTKWVDFSSNSWIQYGFANGTSRVITRYVITSGNDAPERDPKDWVLQGSNDGNNFVDLDARANQSFASRNLSKTYDFTNSIAYKFIRLRITTNYGGVGTIQLSELRLWGPSEGSCTNPTPTPTPGATPTPTPTPTPSSGTGSITREVWNNVPGSNLSSSLFTPTPTTRGTITSFEAPSNVGNDYAQRIRGYLTAPTTGSYTLWIAGDDNCELYLSTTDQYSGRVKIASVPANSYTGIREWNKYSTQKSAAITLQAGKQYYIEALHKEGAGGDNLAVGWAKPGQSTTAPSEVIPGSVLSTSLSSTLVDRTLETGGTITARGENTPNEGKDKAFDNNTGTKWLDFSGTSWIQYGFANGTSHVITRYVITSGNDAPNRDPKNWTLQGSHDGTTFTNLDTQTNQSFASRNLSKTYDFSNSTAYKFYRLNIAANSGGVGTIQLSELRLWGP